MYSLFVLLSLSNYVPNNAGKCYGYGKEESVQEKSIFCGQRLGANGFIRKESIRTDTEHGSKLEERRRYGPRGRAPRVMVHGTAIFSRLAKRRRKNYGSGRRAPRFKV
jgi:hypothetical protein